MKDDKITVSREELRLLVKELITGELRDLVNQFDVLNSAIKQRHIDGALIKRGLASGLPTDGDKSKVYAYFETDTPALKVWDGSAWQTI